MQLPQTTFSGNLAALRMLVVHGNVFAVAAVADIRDESSPPASAVTDASMYILGTRARLRLYSPLLTRLFVSILSFASAVFLQPR